MPGNELSTCKKRTHRPAVLELQCRALTGFTVMFLSTTWSKASNCGTCGATPSGEQAVRILLVNKWSGYSVGTPKLNSTLNYQFLTRGQTAMSSCQGTNAPPYLKITLTCVNATKGGARESTQVYRSSKQTQVENFAPASDLAAHVLPLSASSK